MLSKTKAQLNYKACGEVIKILTKTAGYIYRKNAASEKDTKVSEEENMAGNIFLLNS
jgi:hypothetical protein